MTKAQRIRGFFKQGLADIDIAQRVGCRKEYVRTVRQRTDESGKAKSDLATLRWQSKNWDRHLANCRSYYWRNRERLLASAKRRAEARAS